MAGQNRSYRCDLAIVNVTVIDPYDRPEETLGYDATTHFVGQSTIFTLTADRATGEAYYLAHHVTVNGGKRRLMLASLRYLDTFVKLDGAWLFSERILYVDWLEERALS
jgi:hypothetical protein